MAITGKPYAADNLAGILLHITQMKGVSLPAQTAIRAVAFLLEDAAAVEIASTSETLSSSAKQMNDTQMKLDDITSTLSGNNANTIIGTTTIDSQLEQMQSAVTSLTTQVKESSQQSGYKAALLSGLDNNPDLNSQTIQRAARDAIKARQILMNIAPTSPLAPGKLNHEQLITKIKAALTSLANEDSPELDVKAINQYRNGGIVIEMLTPEGATYLKKKDIKAEFIEKLDPTAMLKDRAYPVVIQFVPLTFNPSSEDQLRKLEQENSWESGAITPAHWIKPPEKRNDKQRVVYVILSFNNPNAANLGIRDGITLNQECLQMKKNKCEPIRCAKCQNYGHIVKECIYHKDTCANCSGEHRTSECNDKNRRCCVSCHSEGHASWDRSCPEFERKCADLDARQLENTMPYFLTDEAWTQMQAPPKAKPYARPNTTAHPDHPLPHTQDTLRRHLAPCGHKPMRGTHLPSSSGSPFRHSSQPCLPLPAISSSSIYE
ncbi:hypothetical protein DFH29DRAFT_817331 [Suillus ampliporus]|nr:hypothetical protein DFH29DRAFT_817331 [Suillus ampliporus]